MEFLNEYVLPIVLGICLCIGYIIKQWVNDVDNKYIPTICAILGIAVSAWISGWNLTPQVVLGGLISGLASTGMHQLFKQYLEKKHDNTGTKV
ncbi:phage holin family protein [Faecalicatena contorta]|uniref:Phage holin family Hol44, holin superfamily V n=1 Tax=Faecalicatena contorta TaxID=39482 RepID=A0A316A1J8_9FIRM|nr:phage holin family protein [Faecalicatena contorta]PWJ51108.1 holin family Hol44 protein (superfamily V) [Faecalicatena contorta]SUQ13676.1 Phage holin family Hol44, holin superfamily V [Faecalicatena contorta]